jgi:hypothetical protein
MMHAGAGGGNWPSSQSLCSRRDSDQSNQRETKGLSVISKTLPRIALFVAVAFASPSSAETALSGNPFDQLKGDWKGGGTVTRSDGVPVKVACRVTYTTQGGTTTQRMRCAGDDYQIKATTKFKYKDGKISGSWNESVYDTSGGVSGTASGNLVHARISGDKFSGRMSINVSDNSHQINIIQLDKGSGAYHSVANILLRR